jgi:hypothetical protein
MGDDGFSGAFSGSWTAPKKLLISGDSTGVEFRHPMIKE